MFSTNKKMLLAGALALSVVGLGTSAVMAEEETPTADASVSIYSTYVWRGFGLSDDSIVIQPSMTVGYKGFAANLWGNLDTDYYATDSTKYNETVITLSDDSAY